MKVTAIFDIGKTNKKFFLFDKNYKEVYKDYTCFKEIQDEDGFPCDDIRAIKTWVKASFQSISKNKQFQVDAINFSAYGASFVHVDKDGQMLSPLYNYLKPYPEELLFSFHQKYGEVLDLATKTASPPLGMLNSGLQLFWLKYTKPELFKKIRWSLHLPQYLSYLFTGIPVSDYTSTGCHTMLWDYEKKDYHQWVYAEEIDRILPPLVETGMSVNRKIEEKKLKVGHGIHDSSAALLPYKKLSKDPFLLLSTGTWSICLNPFNLEPLTKDQLKQDCLNFLGPDGQTVRASRLFLGNEYKIWTRRLAKHFHQALDKHRSVKPDPLVLKNLNSLPENMFRWEGIPSKIIRSTETDLSQFETYDVAYHKLMQELAKLQVDAILLAKGKRQINKIFIDGGFANNALFIHFLKQRFSKHEFIVSAKPLGSAIGAAVVLGE